jgi:TolB protein
MHILLRRILLISLVVLYAPASRSELVIEITKGIETAVPIAVVPFGWQGAADGLPVNISSVVNSDLKRSGFFKTLAERDMLTRPTEVAKVRFRNWKALGQEYLVIGQVNQVEGRYQVQFQLFDIYKGEQLLGYRLTVASNDLRRTAHHISDLVYHKLTGKKGVFSTRIAYVTSTALPNNKKRYKLLVADADGFNPRTIASSSEPLMSPSWSPDGKKLAYVSFENKRAAIYIQMLATGKRERIAAYKGINGAPAFSPDGSRLALTLSKDGSPDIYVLNLKNKSLMKVTKSYGIDTEPTWSPDGKSIVYTSDRGGKPQLYSIPSTGGQSRRLTFSGDYNARGRFSPDGKSIAMVHANRGDYRIAVMDMATRTINVLTAGRYDESPSFSPNGDMILYAARKGKRGVLSAVSIDGRMQQNLAFDSGEVREPAWSP